MGLLACVWSCEWWVGVEMSNWEVELGLRGVCWGVRARWRAGLGGGGGGAGHEVGC